MIVDTTTLLLILICLTVICFFLLLVLLCVCMWGRKVSLRSFGKMDKQMDENLSENREMHYHQSVQHREELVRNLHLLNDSLVNTFSSLSRNQGEQISTLLRQSQESTQNMQRAMDENLRQMEGRIENLRRSSDENMRLLREENTNKLNEIRLTVDEKLNETLEKRLTSSFSQVSERLEQVYRSLGEMHSLASGVGDLKRMLSNVKTRGVWGEIQLGALLEQALTESQYQRNVAVNPHSGERVEFAVCLPGREDGVPVYLPIDSKFPQEDYARLAQAAEDCDQQATETAQKALMNAVKPEARRIGKYIIPPYTTDFAVMFLPLEGLYAEVMRHSETVEAIQREQRVMIAGPSTLLALLNSLQMGFRTLAIEKRSAEVWKLLGAVKSDFSSFAVVLQKTQEKLQQATASIDSAFVKTRNIEKRLRRVEELEPAEAQKLIGEEEEG